jgi:hypothetical protein
VGLSISVELLDKRKLEYEEVLRNLVEKMCSEEEGIGAEETIQQFQVAMAQAESVNINSVTVEGQLDLWLRNFRYNYVRHVLKGHMMDRDIRTWLDLSNKPTLVIGAGPSITDEQLSHISKFNVICTNKILERVLEHTVPSLLVIVDGTEEVLKSFESEKVLQSLHQFYTILPTTVHPDVADRLVKHGAKLFWFNPSIPSEYAPNINYAMTMFSDKLLLTMDAGGNVGIFATAMAKNLGAKSVCLLGLEHCHALNRAWNLEQSLAYKIVFDPRDGMEYAIPPSFQSYVNSLVGFIKENPQVAWFNFTKFGWLYTMRDKIPIEYVDIEQFVCEVL